MYNVSSSWTRLQACIVRAGSLVCAICKTFANYRQSLENSQIRIAREARFMKNMHAYDMHLHYHITTQTGTHRQIRSRLYLVLRLHSFQYTRCLCSQAYLHALRRGLDPLLELLVVELPVLRVIELLEGVLHQAVRRLLHVVFL